MKTPMQEMIDFLQVEFDYLIKRHDLNAAFEVRCYIMKANTLLEKEKEVIMEAFLEGKLDGWQNQWADPNDYYNETFNTKEK